jgi:hypothetical protein
MLRRVALVRTDVSEEISASFIRLVTASVVPSSPILVALMKEALSSSKKSVLRRATWRKIPEDAIRHSHRLENLKSCTMIVMVRPLVHLIRRGQIRVWRNTVIIMNSEKGNETPDKTYLLSM